jgi:hypothetical protein
MDTFIKDPDEKLDFGFDWVKRLAGDTIASSEWEVPTGITESSSPAPTHDESTTTIWLEGGTSNGDYILTNRITTTGGRTLEAALLLAVRNRSEL